MSIALVHYAFERAGLHRWVGVEVRRAVRTASGVLIEVHLAYSAQHPICCAEPACYIPALRPDGLARVAKHIQAEELLDHTPPLTVTVTMVLEEGFQFLEPSLAGANGSTAVYRHPT